jgi:hypothetical protein
MQMKLASLVAGWDNEYEAQFGTDALQGLEKRPFGRMLEGLHEIAPLRFQPYQNDSMPSFMEKLRVWLAQFEAEDQPVAFLVAMKLIFVTQKQLDVLGRRLFEQHIRKRFLETIILKHRLRPYDFSSAVRHLNEEMDETLFIPNSDSSRINDFVHVNSRYFKDRARRRLTGPEVAHWVHPSSMADAKLPEQERRVAKRFGRIVAKRDRLLRNKKRIVVLEDFSGTGSDLAGTLEKLARLDFSVSEILVGVLMATEKAMTDLRELCRELSGTGARIYDIEASMILPQSLRCFGGPARSYLEMNPEMPGISEKLKSISEKLYRLKFSRALEPHDRHGFGGLALAFAFYTNCPDNSLPMIWLPLDDWHPLFPRASRII